MINGGVLVKEATPAGKGFLAEVSREWEAAIDTILRNESLSGPLNLCAPNSVTNHEFTKALNHLLKRPTLFRIPSVLLRALFGEMADEEFLSSIRAVPDKLTSSGFEFQYPRIEEALRHVLKR